MDRLTVSVIFIAVFVATTAWKNDKKPDFGSDEGVQDFLESFAYLAPQPVEEGKGAQASIQLSDGIAAFQKYVNITVTGRMNIETRKWMEKPRCGNPDKKQKNINEHRRKRFILEGSKWKPQVLSYRILNYATTLEPQTQDFIIAQAFQIWSDHIPVDFIRRPWYENCDIDITFLSWGHGDHESFDGRAGILAHAFFPYYGGDIHFDVDDPWTFQDPTNSGNDFLATAVHEIGHALGLSHSDVEGAVMWPYIRLYEEVFELHDDDIQGVQQIYGKREDSSYKPRENLIAVETQTKMPLGTFEPRDFCFEGPINTGVTDGNGSTYLFRGDWFYEVDNYGVKDGFPVQISDHQRGFYPLTGPIDAALYLNQTDELVLFKTYYYASFIGRKFQGWGLINQRFPGIPPNLDDAFVWPINNKVYFLKGEVYWRLNASGMIDPNYPKPMNGWDLPYGTDAAFTYSNNRLYLFRGSKYYRFNDNTYKMDSGYPRDINHWWFGCREFERAESRPQTPGGAHGISSSSGGSSSNSNSTGTRPAVADNPPPPESIIRRARSVDEINPRFRRASDLGSGSSNIRLSLALIITTLTIRVANAFFKTS